MVKLDFFVENPDNPQTIIPFSKIDELGPGLYKGEKITRAERHVECEAQKATEATEVKTDG